MEGHDADDWAVLRNVLTAFLTAICAGLIAAFGFLSNKTWENSTAIAGLVDRTKMDDDGKRREDEDVRSLNQKMIDVLGNLQSLKDADEAHTNSSANIKDQLTDLRKQVSDIDAILRPVQTGPRR